MTTTTQNRPTESKETMVATIHGERFVCGDQTNEGVEFDAGTIPWDEVAGFWTWHKPTERWMFVPHD
jgi:hypothetical protein